MIDPPFNPERANCPKCGLSDDHLTEYVPDQYDYMYSLMSSSVGEGWVAPPKVANEYIKRSCRRCAHHWREAVVSAG